MVEVTGVEASTDFIVDSLLCLVESSPYTTFLIVGSMNYLQVLQFELPSPFAGTTWLLRT